MQNNQVEKALQIILESIGITKTHYVFGSFSSLVLVILHLYYKSLSIKEIGRMAAAQQNRTEIKLGLAVAG